jgi:hypothetical protein
MESDTQPGLIVFTPEGRAWAKQYLCQDTMFVVSELHLDLDDFSDLLSNEISPTFNGVTATVDALYKKGTEDEQPFKIQVLIKWEYVATIFYAKELKKSVPVGFHHIKNDKESGK